MSARDFVADSLEQLDGAWKIFRTYRPPSNIEVGQHVLVVYRESVARSQVNPAHLWDHTVRVWVLTGLTDLDTAEADLDEHMPLVVTRLEATPGLVVGTISRGVMDNAWHGYQIEVSLTAKDI